jgi:hypothetical protein
MNDKIESALVELKTNPSITPTTKRIIAGGLVAINLAVAIGWGFGEIAAKDALIVVSQSTTGFFALMKL